MKYNINVIQSVWSDWFRPAAKRLKNRSMVGALLLMLTNSPAIAAWQYNDAKDEMGRNPVEHHAIVYSAKQDAMFKLYNDDSDKPTGISLALMRGVIGYDTTVVDGLYAVDVAVRLDEGPLETYTMTGMPDYGLDTGLIPGARAGNLVARLKTASTLRVEVMVYGEGPRVFTFDVRGLQGRW